MRVQGYNSGSAGNVPDKKPDAANQPDETQVQATTNNDQAKTNPTVLGSQDTIEISKSAQQLLNTGPGQASAIRPNMVERARKVLQSGTYNDEGVIEATAAKLAEVFSTES